MVPLLFLSSGLLFVALAIPLLRRRVRPNALYGLRVKETLENERVWYEANARSARDLLGVGIGIALAAVLMLILRVGMTAAALLLTIGMLGGVLFACIRGIRTARAVKRELAE